jgi:NADPH-dependent curcumin reductase CurA
MDNRQFVLRARPTELPSRDHFDVRTINLAKPGDGEILVRITMVALSPWQGQRLKDFRNYVRPFEIGELIDCDVMGIVEASGCAGIGVGTRVLGRLGWQEYALTTPERVQIVDDEFPDEVWLTSLHSPALTAYLALEQCGRPMPGQKMVVTSAAGAVGSYAVQLGKLAGMEVIGVAGSATKCAHVTATLGADHGVDYRDSAFEQHLADACSPGADLVFDTVGGSVADTVFDNLAKSATVLCVGRSAANNSADPGSDMVNMRQLWAREATIHCFSRYSYPDAFARAQQRMAELVRADKVVNAHNIIDGFESTPDDWQSAGTLLRTNDHDGVDQRYPDALCR